MTAIGWSTAWLIPGVVLLVGVLMTVSAVRSIRRWKRNMDVTGDAAYEATLATLSESSVRRHFDPYIDIDWGAPNFSVTPDDPRWVLSPADPLGRHPWYRAQPLDKQIAIGMWRQANMAKVTLHLENILIRGLMQYTFWVPNGSPEYRYCLHESVEECNHTLMFQQLVNHIGIDVPGMPRWLRWVSPLLPLYAGPLPNTFFFGVLAGEVPIDHLQMNALREGRRIHPAMEKVMAIHVAEEARHISFAHEYLRRRVPHTLRRSRFGLSLYVPIIMRLLCQAILVPPRNFFTEFGIPRPVRKELFFGTADSQQTLQAMFADIRMLCDDVGLMNPVARLMWRACGIGGRPSRYRGEPQRAHLPTSVR